MANSGKAGNCGHSVRFVAERKRVSGSGCVIDTATAQALAPQLGVLAPNSPWRELVTAQAGRKLAAGRKPPRSKAADADSGAPRSGHPTRYLWAQLLARIYGVFALKCSGCGGRVRLIGFIIEPATVRQILAHVGEPTSAPAIAPARSPPVEVNAQQLIALEAVEAIPALEFDQTANLTAEAGDNQWTSPADAEPVLKLEFDQTLGW